jgi:hypothetical protein
MPFVPLESSALRLGLFIKLEGSWLNHPFPTNSFKILAPKDLETLKGLKKVKLFVDIDRSDPEALATEDILDSPAREQPGNSPVEEAIAPQQDDDDDANPSLAPVEEVEAEDPMQRKVAQHEAFQDYQSHLQLVENQFQEVLQESKRQFRTSWLVAPVGFARPKKSWGISTIC